MMTTTTHKTMRRTALLFATMVLALVVSSGGALAVTKSCEGLVQCFGTRKADTLNGSDGQDHIYGKGRGDTLNSFIGNDYLYGQGGADKLFDGPGVDFMTGGPGNDALSGGEDPDSYYFGDGWGKDSITDDGTGGLVALFGGPDDFVYVSEDLAIKLVSGEGPEVKNASGTSTINWEANAITPRPTTSTVVPVAPTTSPPERATISSTWSMVAATTLWTAARTAPSRTATRSITIPATR